MTSNHRNITLLTAALSLSLIASAQTPQTPPAVATPAGNPAPAQDPEQPHGTVLFERHSDDDALPKPVTASPKTAPVEDARLSGAALSDDDRSAVRVISYSLDARITPTASQLDMRAGLMLRNDSTKPLTRIALQVSSTLAWQSISLLNAQHTRLAFEQHLLDTDTDHTGKSNEVIVTLPEPLAPGKVIALDTFYSGAITPSSDRLERIGAGQGQALPADWDTISAESIALRGFGNVLWYPVASPQLFLGDGARLFQGIGRSRLRDRDTTISLNLSIEYHGEPPTAAYFCGRRQPLAALPDDPNDPVASGNGIATAEFPPESLGFRSPSLFVANAPETLTAPLSTDTAGKPTEDILAVETTEPAVLPRLSDSAQSLAGLLQNWLGPHPLTALTVLDHEGQPFEDGPLLVAPIASLSASGAQSALTHSLTHAWVQTGQPWIDEGLPQFMALLHTEQQQNRDAATAELHDLLVPLVLAEPSLDALSSEAAGQPLIAATGELYYRRKAAAVWWMLRSLTSDEALQTALTTMRLQPPSSASASQQAVDFQHLLEKTSHKDLGWFFADWVLRDRGLPDLTISDVTPRQLPAGKGHDSGWLVAVTVRNDGAAAAEVPLIIRAGTFSTTRSMRIPGLSSVTDRIVLEAQPTQVLLNDGNTPEVRNSQHTVNVTVQRQ